MKNFLRLLVGILFILLVPFTAYAETAQGFVIDFGPLFALVIWPFLTVVAGAIATVIAYQIKKRWGVDIDKKTVETAMQNGLQLAQAKLASSDITKLTVQSEIVANAANYAVAHVPDALKNVGVDVTTAEGRGKLEERITARLAPAVMVGAASPSDTPMTVAEAATIANPNVAVSAPVPLPEFTSVQGIQGEATIGAAMSDKEAVLAAAAIPGVQVHIDPVDAPLPLIAMAENPDVKDVVPKVG